MKSEFVLDICFIRERSLEDRFIQSVELLLESLFAGKARWNAAEKQEEGLDIVIAEVAGHGDWEEEEDMIRYLKEHAPSHFWEWLQGYRLEIDVKQKAECSHCGKHASAAGAS